jgi:hypothetical protein
VRGILAFTVIVEVGTGLAFLADPAIVAALLVGADLSSVGVVVGRCFGITLVALGLACWPGAGSTAPAVRGMLLYNAATAVFLAYLGTVGHLGGPLLWPAAVLHGVVAGLLAATWRRDRNAVSGD